MTTFEAIIFISSFFNIIILPPEIGGRINYLESFKLDERAQYSQINKQHTHSL